MEKLRLVEPKTSPASSFSSPQSVLSSSSLAFQSLPVWSIGVISFLILVWELAMIRFIPSEVKAISYFTNLVLFAAFFGLGLGCMMQNIRPKQWVLPLGVFALFAFTYVSRGIVIYDSGENVHFWLQANWSRFKPFADLPLIITAMIYFLLIGSVFFSLGHSLSNALSAYRRLYGYGWDLFGSLAGTITFAATSYLGFSPIVWMISVPIIYAWMLPFGRDYRLATTLSGLIFACFSMNQYETKWSPYYLVNFFESSNNVSVFVNSSFHQEAINFSSEDPSYKPLAQSMLQKFSVPYELYKKYHQGQRPHKVLILGAGTGNDVLVALKNGIEDITAVEIDPVILNLGKERNAGKPYDHPGVKVVLDDARHFLWNTKDKYDLIVFGTLDSQTLLSGHANLRLDNYVYTSDSFNDAKKALHSGGMIATYYSVFKSWFFSRIYSTIRVAFPDALQIMRFTDNYLFNTIIIAAKDLPEFKSDPQVDQDLSKGFPSEDNWPFIYIEEPGVSTLYIQIMIFIACLSLLAFAYLRARSGDREVSRSLFLMGMGFTLLESAAIVRLSLLFGATWIVSTVVFSSALVMMFLGNFVVYKVNKKFNWIWPLLGAAILANILIKPSWLLGLGDLQRILASATMVGIPILCASIGFSVMFKDQKNTGYALGINLIGAMGGGAVEYLSMWLGMNSIWYIVLGIYGVAGALWMIDLRTSKDQGERIQRGPSGLDVSEAAMAEEKVSA